MNELVVGSNTASNIPGFPKRLIAVLLVAYNGCALAQGSSDTRRVLEEVVVTAQLREQSLQEVPTSVQALSGEDLAAAGVVDMDSLVQLSPSISINRFLAPYQATIRIRGVGTSVSSPIVEPSVSMVVDGVVVARQGAFFTELADIERIEILRGPQSTLFGKNSVAGAVNITTRNPSLEETSGMIEANYNDYGDLNIRGTINGPLGKTVAGSLTASFSDEGDGIHKNIYPGGPSLDNNQSQGLRAKLYWEASDDLDLTFIADTRQADGPNTVRTPVAFESMAVQNLFALGPVNRENRTMNFNGGPFNKHFYDVDDSGVSLQINYSFNDLTLTSITAYRQWDMEQALDADQIGTTVTPSGYDDNVIIPGVGPVSTGRFPLTGSTQVWGELETDQFSQEIRLLSPDDTRFRWLVGGFYWETSLEFDNRQVQALCPFNTEAPGFTAPPATAHP
jgi:iron complex outermembrane receptor protein